MGVGGREAFRVSKSGVLSGSNLRVIQNSKGFELKLKAKSELP